MVEGEGEEQGRRRRPGSRESARPVEMMSETL